MIVHHNDLNNLNDEFQYSGNRLHSEKRTDWIFIQIPVIVNNSNMYDWLRSNAIGYWCHVTTCRMGFTEADDIVAFKLAWF